MMQVCYKDGEGRKDAAWDRGTVAPSSHLVYISKTKKCGLYFEFFEYSEQICQGDFKVIRLQVLGHSLPTQL